MGAAALGANSLDGLDDFHSFDNFTKDDVPTIQLKRRKVSDRLMSAKQVIQKGGAEALRMTETYPRAGDCGDEELGAVSVGPGVSHREKARAVVLQLEVLICSRVGWPPLARFHWFNEWS